MARFEKRISDEQVRAARQKIAAGATLRSAAAEIPCAPSTLSVRIKKAEAAEVSVGDRAPIADQELAAVGRAEYVRELKRIALGYDPTASARDRLTAIKELLKLEPARSEQAAAGAVFHVLPDGTTIEAEAEGEVVAQVDEGRTSASPK